MGPETNVQQVSADAEVQADQHHAEQVGEYLAEKELEVRDPYDVQPNSQPLLLLKQQSRALHDQQDEVGDHDEEGAINGDDAHALYKPTAFGREVCKLHGEVSLGLVVLDDGLVYIFLELDGDVVFGVGVL